MADPITVVQLISAATGLAAQCAQVIKQLHDLRERIKAADISIRSMAHELDIVRLAWERIEISLQSWESNEQSDHDLLQRLRQSVEFGDMVVTCLAEDLNEFTKRSFTLPLRSKWVWNETKFKEHQDRIRGQVGAMNLLVSVLNLPSNIERVRSLHEGAEILRKSDESALSIVPSHLSSRLPSIYSDYSSLSVESAELVYRRLSIDDDLFTARVYKRNYRPKAMRMQLPSQARRAISGPAQIESVLSNDASKVPLRNFQRLAIGGCAWGTMNSQFTGPAISLDLVYLEQGTVELLDLLESVWQTQPIDLEHLLKLIHMKFVRWRREFLVQACGMLQLDLIPIFLDNDKRFASHLRSATPATKLFEIACNKESVELLRILYSHEVSAPEAVSSDGLIVQMLDSLDGQPHYDQGLNEHFLEAVRSSEWNFVEMLLVKGKLNISLLSLRNGRTCLHQIVLAFCDLNIPASSRVKQLAHGLFTGGVDLTAQDYKGENIFHIAASSISPALSDFFYNLRFDPAPLLEALNAQNIQGKTPQELAISAKNSDFVDCVVEFKRSGFFQRSVSVETDETAFDRHAKPRIPFLRSIGGKKVTMDQTELTRRLDEKLIPNEGRVIWDGNARRKYSYP